MLGAAANKTRLAGVALILLCLALFLTAYSARNPGLARIGSSLFTEAISPLQFMTFRLHSQMRDLWSGYVALRGARQEAHDLRARVLVLEEENSRLRELEHENQRMQSLLAFKSEHALTGLAANVIGHDPSNWVKAVTIGAGSAEGVRIGMPVVAGKGLAGQIIAAGYKTSRVLLITDSGSGVDAIAQESRARGIVSGLGADDCEMRYVLREESVQVGARIITSGMDGIYPKGLLVGTVRKVGNEQGGLFKSVLIHPATDFARLESVLVIGAAKQEQTLGGVP